MNSDAAIHALRVVRNTCMALKDETTPAVAAKLDMIGHVLAKLIADVRDLPGLKQDLLRQFGPRLAALQEPGSAMARDFDAGNALLQRALRANGAVAPDLCRLAAEIGGRYADEYAGAISRASVAQQAETTKPAGEDFDTGRLRDYLVAAFPTETALRVRHASVASYGSSKKTLIVGLANNASLPDEIVLRMDRPYNFLGTTVVDEYAPLRVLHARGVRLPKPYAMEASGNVAGAPFVIFEKVNGAAIGSNFRFPPRNPALARDIAACLAQLHRTPLEALPGLRGANASAAQVVAHEIDKSYGDWIALGRDIPLIEAAFTWLRANSHSAQGRRAIVHGDFNFNNLLIEGDRIDAIVDWEFVHVDNPAADLGWFHYGADSIAGWEGFLQLYEEAGGIRPEPAELDYYILLGQTRLAVMSLQVETGFDAGKLDDIRFALPGPIYVNVLLGRVSRKLSELLAV